jgi:hypothetical protein
VIQATAFGLVSIGKHYRRFVDGRAAVKILDDCIGYL